MNIYKFFTILILLFVTSLSFAETKKVILFLESLDGISPKVIKQVASSDSLCFCTRINNPRSVAASIKELITVHKVEPTLFFEEPYFPLISEEISNGKIDINMTQHLDTLLAKYKTTFRSTFEKTKFGLFVKYGIFNEATLDKFYKQNVAWFTTSLTNDTEKTAFIKNGVVVFVPYKEFVSSARDIKQWFDEIQEEFIPVIVPSVSVRNETFMTVLFKFLDKNKTYETYLPLNAAYLVAKKYDYQNTELAIEKQEPLSNEILIKMTNASKETELHNNKKEAEKYEILCDELSSMFSAKIIQGILNGDISSQKLFDISYANIFGFAGKEIPKENIEEDIQQQSKEKAANTENEQKIESEIEASFMQTEEGYKIENNNIIKFLSVIKNINSVTFEFEYDNSIADEIVIYIDMNAIAYAGCQTMLNNAGFFVPENCWEYALKIKDSTCEVYRFASDTATKIKTISLESAGKVVVDSNVLRGNPYNWNYQLTTLKDGKVKDFLEKNEARKEKIFKSKPVLLRMMPIN